MQLLKFPEARQNFNICPLLLKTVFVILHHTITNVTLKGAIITTTNIYRTNVYFQFGTPSK